MYMLSPEYKPLVVQRYLGNAVSSAIRDRMLEVSHELHDDARFPGLRASGSGVPQTLLGMYKMDYAIQHAKPGSKLDLEPLDTIRTISKMLVKTYATPVHLRIGSLQFSTEKNRDRILQAVLRAHFITDEQEDIGQNYAAEELKKASGGADVWPHQAQMTLLFADVSIFKTPGAKDIIKSATLSALGDMQTFNYGPAKNELRI